MYYFKQIIPIIFDHLFLLYLMREGKWAQTKSQYWNPRPHTWYVLHWFLKFYIHEFNLKQNVFGYIIFSRTSVNKKYVSYLYKLKISVLSNFIFSISILNYHDTQWSSVLPSFFGLFSSIAVCKLIWYVSKC